MTIDEAIAHAREVAKKNREICRLKTRENAPSVFRYAEEHEQLAEWLEELKFLRQWKSDVMDEFCKYDCNSVGEAIHNGYIKAIDDFVERLTTYLGVENATKYGNKNAEQMRNSYDTLMKYEIADAIDDIAEQLKAGGENEQII